MTIARRLEAAARATPGVGLNIGEFAEVLQARLSQSSDPERELSALHVEDLYLAWALGRGDAAAFARFEREYLSLLATQIKGASAEAGELEQLVRTRLFVASEGQVRRIVQYTGRGPFGGWLRVTATRCLLDLQRSRQGHVRVERELDNPGLPTDPELDYLKLRYAADFKQALEAALSGLDARQLTLLKLSFIEQLSTAAIGVMYGVSSRTVQRWLVDLRESVLAKTREGLHARLGLEPAELESLLGLVDSQLELSLHRVLGQLPT
jgi:RNA polymerase sigma-70 factor, ECF subfamily